MQMHEGYYMVDHRASPGLPNDPLRGEGMLFETKTNHCNHCGRVVIINPLRTRERAFCSKCLMYICDLCGIACKETGYEHKTYQQQLDLGYEILLKENTKNG